MHEKTENDIIATKNPSAKYDACAKRLFKNKEIVAPVLQMVVPEFEGLSIEEIMKYIDAASFRDVPVDDVKLYDPTLDENNVEDKKISEKLIYFDVVFKAVNPKLSNQEIKILIHFDLEIQNNYKPKYPITKRMVYYLAREISKQLGTLTETSDYNSLSKVYSIWICNDNIPIKLKNTVTRYKLAKEDVIGITDEPEEDYDLMEGIIIRLGSEEAPEGILEYLKSVFSSKKEIMKKYSNVDWSDSVEEEVETMSGFSAAILKEGKSIGFKEGRTIGHDEGVAEGITIERKRKIKEADEYKIKVFNNCLAKGISIENARDIAGITDEQARAEVRKNFKVHSSKDE